MSNRGRGNRGQPSRQAGAAEDPRVDGVLRALEAIGDLMGRQARERATVVAEAAAAAINSNQGNGNGDRQMHQIVEQFLKLKPPKFDGKGDPEAATLWVEELEKAFELLRCTEEDKVVLTVYLLQAFNGKYFSESAQKQKMTEFLRLRQNQLTGDLYEAEFARLSKFALRMVENPLDRARRFQDGLKPELRSQLILLNLKDYNELYEQAQMVELDMTERAAASG
ncbi:uncharacterized protein LOC115675255 [Syzygium oleosum]|uniref:uncharacterized protein LOC115675255 n=1 Tax=Syzygium oleosum TaxID=219896 RepID=UPI0024BA1410|nr:uncharacterized protein LOC115675255 [Syzygium oleosum]